jgi:hypothetical protein
MAFEQHPEKMNEAGRRFGANAETIERGDLTVVNVRKPKSATSATCAPSAARRGSSRNRKML